MRFRSTLILALLALALGAYVVFVEFERAAKDEEKETLLTFETDDVTAVALTYPEGAIRIERSGDAWQLTEPIATKADTTTVDSLIRAVADCEVKKTLEDASQDLSVYGLAEPSATVEVTLASGALPVVRVGKTTPVGHSTYVQRADKAEVFLTDSAFHTGMKKELKDLRDKKILTFDEDEVHGITIRGETSEVVLAKNDGSWQLERPAAHAADPQTVRTFLSTLRNLRAIDFHDDGLGSLAGFGLDQPRLAVSFAAGDVQQEVLVGDDTDDNNVYLQVAGQPTIYEVGNWTFRDLNKIPNDFRDKTVIAFDKHEVVAVELVGSQGEAVVLQRGEGDAWTMHGESAMPEPSAIDDFLDDLVALKGQDIAADSPDDLGAYGLASPRVTVTLTGENDASLAAVLLGTYADGDETKYTVMRKGGSTVFHIAEYQFGGVDKNKGDFLPEPTPTAAAEDAG